MAKTLRSQWSRPKFDIRSENWIPHATEDMEMLQRRLKILCAAAKTWCNQNNNNIFKTKEFIKNKHKGQTNMLTFKVMDSKILVSNPSSVIITY